MEQISNLLPQLRAVLDLQVSSGSKVSEIGNISIAEQALNGRQIKDCTDQEVGERLKRIFLMVGLRPQHLPANEEKDLLLDFIRRNFGSKTLDEIILAFELAITGKLDIKDVKVYDYFSCEYFSRIMEGYRGWLKLQAQNKETFKKEQPMIEQGTAMSDSEEDEYWGEWLPSIKNYNVQIIPVAAYDYLVKKGMEVSLEMKKEYYERAINYQMNNFTPGSPQHAEILHWNKTRPKDDTHKIIAALSKKMIVKDELNK